MKVYVALLQERSETARLVGTFDGYTLAQQACAEYHAWNHEGKLLESDWEHLSPDPEDPWPRTVARAVPSLRSALGVCGEYQVMESELMPAACVARERLCVHCGQGPCQRCKKVMTNEARVCGMCLAADRAGPVPPDPENPLRPAPSASRLPCCGRPMGWCVCNP